MAAIQSQSMMTTKGYYRKVGCMDAKSELSMVAHPSEFDVNDSSISREVIMQYIDAGLI